MVGGTENGLLYIWGGEQGRLLQKLSNHQHPIKYCEFSADNSKFLSADTSGKMVLWQLTIKMEVNYHVELKPHEGSIEMVIFYLGLPPRRIVSCGSDKNLHLYDGSSGNFIKKMLGHSDSVVKVDVSYDGSMIVSGDKNGKVILWDGFTGEMKRKFSCPDGEVEDLHFMCGSAYVCALDIIQGNNVVHIYDTLTGSYTSCLLFSGKITSISTSKGEPTWMVCTLNDESVKFVQVYNLH